MIDPEASHLSRMPVLFMGHGSPMNAIEANRWSEGFRSLREVLPRPKAILAVSAHWVTRGTHLTSDEQPATIHDFGGFPAPLYEVQYPAPGDPALAQRVSDLLAGYDAGLRGDWGLDHGTWSVLLHVFPEADVPVVQLSIDGSLPTADHLDVGAALAPLREEGVLILGSGNIVHNLRDAFGQMRRGHYATPIWATAFDGGVADALSRRDHAFLAHALDGEDGRQAHPTTDHYLPLLYAAGAAGSAGEVSFPITGFDMGSLSMRAALFT
jgi:4,5-DOPA dioxygenase extradiol